MESEYICMRCGCKMKYSHISVENNSKECGHLCSYHCMDRFLESNANTYAAIVSHRYYDSQVREDEEYDEEKNGLVSNIITM